MVGTWKYTRQLPHFTIADHFCKFSWDPTQTVQEGRESCSLKGCHVGQRYHYSAGLACSLCLKDFTVFELARLFNIEAIWASSGERSSSLHDLTCLKSGGLWHSRTRIKSKHLPYNFCLY